MLVMLSISGVAAPIRPGNVIYPKMVKDTNYLRCTPLGISDSKKRKAHVLLHSESK